MIDRQYFASKARINLINGRFVAVTDAIIDELGVWGLDSRGKEIYIPLSQVEKAESI